MPRAPRIEFGGAIYHVMNRGDRLEAIFEDDTDRTVFLQTLTETCQSAGWSAHSWVLMGNHYHLLVETHRATLVKGMQYLNSTYTRRYNVRHRKWGHVFQGRYKALLVDGESPGYFLTVSDYIHLNPVRVGRVHKLEDLLKDRWNSAGWLAGTIRGRPEWMRWERVYGELGLENWRSRSRWEYRGYLERRLRETRGKLTEGNAICRGWCWGGEAFVQKMKERLEDLSLKKRDGESWNGVAMEELEEERAGRLLKTGLETWGYGTTAEVPGWERLLLARWIRSQTKVSVKWLARQLGMRTRGGMSNGIYLVGQRLANHRALQERWRKLDTVI